MVGLSEKALPSSGTGKKQGPDRRRRRPTQLVVLEKIRKVFAGRGRVAEVELHRLALAQILANGQKTPLLVEVDHIANQEITRLELLLEFGGSHAELQPIAHPLLVPGQQRLIESDEDLDRGLIVQLMENLVFAMRDGHRRTDWTAALSDDGIDLNIALESNADQARIMQVLVYEQRIALKCRGQTTNLHPLGIGIVYPGKQRAWIAGRRSDRIGQEHEAGRLGTRHSECFFPGFGAFVRAGKGLEMESAKLDAGKTSGTDRDRGYLFDFAQATDDPRSGTTDKGTWSEVSQDPFRYMSKTLTVLGRDESANQIGVRTTQLLADRAFDLGECCFRV